MATKEIKLNLFNRNVEVFLHDSFFTDDVSSSIFHYHSYAEVHFTISGECSIYTENQRLRSSEGVVTVIPRGLVHMFTTDSPSTIGHKAFLINSPIDKVIQKQVPKEELLKLNEELEEYKQSGDFGRAAISIAYLCKDILHPKIEITDVDNREFIINEFFANRYAENVTLSDLAEELGISTKQTSRLIKTYTGESYSQIIQRKRLEAVTLLLKTNANYPLKEIVSMVGYGSYSGFWKAYQKAKSEN